MITEILHNDGPCPQCGSDDCWVAVSWQTIYEIEVKVKRRYCNPCPYHERWVYVNDREVYHDVTDGNTMRMVKPGEAKKP